MSRAAAAPPPPPPSAQLTTLSSHFMTEITQANGKKTCVISAQAFSDQSFVIDNTHNKVLFNALMALCHMMDKNNPMPMVCMCIIAVLPGFVTNGNSNNTVSIPRFPFFKMINSHHISTILDAVMRGEEAIAMQAISDNPKALLQAWTVKNSVGVEYNVTPLQAAIMANDAQTAQSMETYFKDLNIHLKDNSIDGLAEMHQQIKEIYTESLNRYLFIQSALKEQAAKQFQLLASDTLNDAQRKQYQEIKEKIQQATKNIAAYTDALEGEDIHAIFEAHNQAQADNAFDYKPYVDAILNSTQAELDEVMELINATTEKETQDAVAKGVSPVEIGFTKDGRVYTREEVQALPLSELTLIQKLNRFREKLVEHMQQEIIFNPHHILEGLKVNETAWNDFEAGCFTDPRYKKVSVIFSGLVGEAQRNASEPVKQDIRQGTYYLTKTNYLTETNEPRSRPSRFNAWDNATLKIARSSLVDVSLIDSSSFDGLGYKFACACTKLASRHFIPMAVGFQNLCRAKTASFQNLLHTHCGHAPARVGA